MECRPPERQLIGLVETIWDIECRRLLGTLSPAERRLAVADALGASQPLPCRDKRLALEVDRD